MILILTMRRQLHPAGSIHREWCCIISSDKQPLSLSLSLSRHPIMILRQTQADTRSVPIGRTVARERCRLNVDRICCLVHFRHENNCRIWIFITRRLFILRLYRGNISKRGRSFPPHPSSKFSFSFLFFLLIAVLFLRYEFMFSLTYMCLLHKCLGVFLLSASWIQVDTNLTSRLNLLELSHKVLNGKRMNHKCVWLLWFYVWMLPYCYFVCRCSITSN